jgi:hypothetical protein
MKDYHNDGKTSLGVIVILYIHSKFMLNIVFIDIVKKLDPNNTQHILEIINDSFDKK